MAVLKLAKKASPKIAGRLEHEARVQARVVHPHVVRVLQSVQIDGAAGIVMSLVEGPSLAMLLQRRSLTLPEALAMGETLIQAVGAIHAAGVIHRDLKPSNILVGMQETAMAPYITDFGLACILADDDFDSLRSGVLYGTPGYMSPERLIDPQNTDVRSDIFALGAILYQLVCGKQAFPAGSDSIFVDIAEGRFERPARTLNLPSHIEIAVVGCLLPNVKSRIPDCKTLLALWRGEGSTQYALPVGLLDDLDALVGVYRSDLTIIPSEEDLVSGEHMMPVPQFSPLVRHLTLPATLAPPVAQEPVAPPTERPAPATVLASAPAPAAPVASAPVASAPVAAAAQVQKADRSKAPLLLLVAVLLLAVGVWVFKAGQRTIPVGRAAEPAPTDAPVLALTPSPAPAQEAPPQAAVEDTVGAAAPVSAPATKGHTLTLRSSPQRAEVWEGRTRLGTTPLVLPIDQQTHTYALRRRDYASVDYTQAASETDVDRTISLSPLRDRAQDSPVPAAREAAPPVAANPAPQEEVVPPAVAQKDPTPAPTVRAQPARAAAPVVAAPAEIAPPAATLTDLDVSVSPTSVTLRGRFTGNTRPLGMLMEDETGCEYRVKLAGTRSDVGLSRLPVASALVQQVTVTDANGSVTVRARCGASGFAPNLNASADGFVLVLSQK